MLPPICDNAQIDFIYPILGALGVIFALLLGAGSSGGGISEGPSSTTTSVIPTPVVPTPVVPDPENKESFVYGVLTLKDRKFEITDYRVIPIGAEGNRSGDTLVLAIWYNTTNLGTTQNEITPTSFIYYFDAYQDNDLNKRNKLKVGWHPDSTLVGDQLAEIKSGEQLRAPSPMN